jgi:hypothetical protein
MSYFDIYNYISNYDKLKEVKINQFKKQNIIIGKLNDYKCPNTINKFLVQFHNHMVKDSIAMYNTPIKELYNASEKHIAKRENLLKNLDDLIKEGTVCKNLHTVTNELSKNLE